MARKGQNSESSSGSSKSANAPYEKKPASVPKKTGEAMNVLAPFKKCSSYTSLLLSRSSSSKVIKFKGLKQLSALEKPSFATGKASYASLEAPPAVLKPSKRYCDLTGLEGKYVDPKSKLYYHSPEVYAWIQSQASSGSIQGYLGLRQASTMLI